VAGVALVNKLRAILLMEANFNYMNKWVFGYQAINKMYALGTNLRDHKCNRPNVVGKDEDYCS
jgi:hypothetical protein